jgi:hypothetical protein
MKLFYQQDGIGKVRYVINYYDGVQRHPDGSPFYGIYTFQNKKALMLCRAELLREGYVEGWTG